MTTDAPVKRRRRPRPFAVIAGSLALFLVLFTLLAWQLRTGRDPAVGAGPVAVQPASQRVIVKRVVKRVVVTRTVVDEGDDGAPATSAVVQSVSSSGGSAPAQAPAPLQTRASGG